MAKIVESNLTPLQRLLRLAAVHRRAIRAVVIYAGFIGLINLSLPLGIQAIIGLIAGGAISASWGVLLIVVIIGTLFVGLLRYLQMAAMEQMQRNIIADSAIEFSVRIPHLQLSALRREHLPELINRFFDTLTIQKGLPKIVVDGSTALFSAAISLLIVSFYHPLFLSFSIGMIVLMLLLFWLTFSRGLETSLNESKYKYKIAHWLEEVGRVSSTLKLAGSHKMSVRRTDEYLVAYLKERKKHFRILVAQFMGSVVMRVFTVSSFLIFGSLLVMDNSLNIGQFVAAEILIIFVVDSLEKIILLMETVYDVLTATEKIGQFTDLPVESDKGIIFSQACPQNRLAVEWRNLTYQFADSDKPVLKNLNLKVEAGEKIAIVGYNGSGKSTLMQINAALISDFSGALLYNGLPMANLHINSLRENIGDLSSQEDIFKGSLLDNILLDRDVDIAKVLQTIERTGLSDFVQELPEGLNTILLPSGKGIPGSIQTKILLSRAILTDPAMLILEYPLLKLDATDRERISQLLTDPKNGWTLLCVTEAPTLAALCDRVVVIKEGEIVMTGTFSEIRKSEHFEKVFRVD